jgi:hypothetical protein
LSRWCRRPAHGATGDVEAESGRATSAHSAHQHGVAREAGAVVFDHERGPVADDIDRDRRAHCLGRVLENVAEQRVERRFEIGAAHRDHDGAGRHVHAPRAALVLGERGPELGPLVDGGDEIAHRGLRRARRPHLADERVDSPLHGLDIGQPVADVGASMPRRGRKT